MRFISALALLVTALPASAEWLRVDFHTITTPFLTFLGPEPFDELGVEGEAYAIDGWMVFDTDAPPDPRTGIDFAVADFQITARRYDGAGAEPIVLDPDNAAALVVVRPATGGVQFSVTNSRNTFTYDIPQTATLFSSGMASLPDLPGDYAPSDVAPASVVCTFIPESGTTTDCTWERGVGYEIWKHIRYHVRPTHPPAPKPCGPADINADGFLNFDDIDAFVDGFLGGCR